MSEIKREMKARKSALKKATEKGIQHAIQTGEIKLMRLISILGITGTVLPATIYA